MILELAVASVLWFQPSDGGEFLGTDDDTYWEEDMRYDVHNLKDLKDAVESMSSQDRMVIFPKDAHPIRVRMWDDQIDLHDCDETGRELIDGVPR